MDTEPAPKVFVIHASEDKDRFVIPFAERLRENGVDVWLDKWEMLPGDSLIDKIFEEGLRHAKAILIIVSKHSINKPWVREELNAAMVRKIEGRSKLIPIVIDDCEVPECLKSTVWEKVSDLNNFEEPLKRVLLSIFGKSEKPALGSPPKYALDLPPQIGSLTALDSSVFCKCCEFCLERDSERIDPGDLLMIGRSLAVGESDFLDCLKILGNASYLKLQHYLRSKVPLIELTNRGLGSFLEHTRSDYSELYMKIAFKIVNENSMSGDQLKADIQEKNLIINQIVNAMANRGLFKIQRYLGGPLSFRIWEISPEMKRWLQGME